MSFQEKDFNILIYLYREIMILLINIREIIQSINIFKLIFGNMFILSLRSKIRFFKFLFQQQKNTKCILFQILKIFCIKMSL